jgi:5-methyltetrahydrofolate--homocysteine methyltransferase
MKDLREILKERIILKDGSVGISLSRTPEGAKVPFYELLNLEAPEVVRHLHLQYLDVGAELITTNSFSAHPYALRDWGFEEKAYQINFEAAKIARSAVDQSGKQAWVVGSLGPTAASLTLCRGNIDFDMMKEGYKLEAKALLDGGADFLLIETIHDPLNSKAAKLAIFELIEEGYKTEIALSMTVDLTGISLSGQSVASFVVESLDLNPLYIGLNCSTGPLSLLQPICEMNDLSPIPIALFPNAGLPDENGIYDLTSQIFADQMEIFLQKGFLNIVGGCCGTTPEHISLLAKLIKNYEPRKNKPEQISNGMIAGLDVVSLRQKPSPMIVGERANTLGSKKFKGYVTDGKTGKIIETLRKQSLSGAHALDISFASADLDEISLWKKYAPEFNGLIKQPVFIDTISVDVITEALKYLPGKPVVNSVNLEDSGKRIEQIAKLHRHHPFAVVAGLIDENGMAQTLEQKIKLAERIHHFLISNGFKQSDIILDPLVFPLESKVHPYESIKAIEHLKKKFPDSPIILGISNISFGLPSGVREILNSTYLKLALDAGLDIAIINISDLARISSLSDSDKQLAQKILVDFDQPALKELIGKHRGEKKPIDDYQINDPDPKERLIKRVIDGFRDGVRDDIRELLKTMPPLEIINGPLMAGMDRVGKMFEDGRLIISEVLLSAEVFKASMDILLPEMKSGEKNRIGKIILATVKGDVHDIGRNLVRMMCESHGFEVIDLGCKVSPDTLIEAIKEHNPDAVGLSGLLVRSAFTMRETAEALKQAGISVPLVVGGAALSLNFTAREIAPAYTEGTVRYAKDCIDAVRIFREVIDGNRTADYQPAHREKQKCSVRKTKVKVCEITPPEIPDYDIYILNSIPVNDLIPYFDWKMLIHKHLGARLARKDNARKQLDSLLQKALDQDIFHPAGVFEFFKAGKRGKTLLLFENNSQVGKITFTRSDSGLCATDWITKNPDYIDSVALMVVTAGSVKEAAEQERNAGNLLYSYAIEAFSLEIADATASYVHNEIRKLWNLDSMSGGIRLSPGYPCCPDLKVQRTIFNLLHPEKIGVSLTDEMMMDPEASVSAIVFHHPGAIIY